MLEIVVKRCQMDEDLFVEHNKVPVDAEDFDQLYVERRGFGKLLESISRCCGRDQIYPLFGQKLQIEIQKETEARNNGNSLELTRVACQVECILFCVTKIIK